MSTQYANGKIINSGLVLALDAADRNSYPGSGTTWSDVSGNGNSGTLTNGPTFSNNSIVFDGTNDYVNTSITTAYNDFTIGVWFKQVGNIIGYQRLVDKDYISGFWIGRNASVANSWGGGVLESGDPYGRFITLTDGNWHYIVSKREGSIHTIYGDGITNTISGNVSTSALSGVQITIGTQQGIGAYLNGNIAQVSIYNRALSSQEISQNYNAQKSRFNL
jgi:hypothetical protein